MQIEFRNDAGETKHFDLERKSRKRTIVEGDVVWRRIPRPKYQSRATRCANACTKIQLAVDNLRSLASEAEEDVDLTVLKDQVAEVEIDISTLEELKEEVEAWKDSMEGTNLDQSEKYSMLEECHSQLEDIVDTLENIDLNIHVEDKDGTEVAQAITEIADEIEAAVVDAEGVGYPGMYG